MPAAIREPSNIIITDRCFRSVTVEMMVLVWGIRLCIVVRKAPSEFNESRFISMAIYNEFLLSVFLNVSMYVYVYLYTYSLHAVVNDEPY